LNTVSKAFFQMAIGALWTVACTGVSHATTATFILGYDPNQVYMGVNVGPYPGSLTGSGATEFFCLNLDKPAAFDTSYPGTVSEPVGQSEDEVAFLSAYLLSKGSPGSDPNFVQQYEGPISFAIWQIMGTLGSTAPDPAAAQFVTLAQNAYNQGLITTAFLSNFLVFTPDNDSIQSFITVVGNVPAPEPGTMLLLGSGLLAAVLFAWRWRKPVG